MQKRRTDCSSTPVMSSTGTVLLHGRHVRSLGAQRCLYTRRSYNKLRAGTAGLAARWNAPTKGWPKSAKDYNRTIKSAN